MIFQSMERKSLDILHVIFSLANINGTINVDKITYTME